MATSARALAHSSKISKSVKATTVAAKRPRVPVVDPEIPETPETPETAESPESKKIDVSDIEEAFCDLTDSFRAYECLQSFLSPRYPLGDHEEFHIEPNELRGLVTVLNADMERHLRTLRGAIDEVRVKSGGTVPDRG